MPNVTFERFGGLNLADDVQELGSEQAQDCMNVEFNRRGRVRTRRGFDLFDQLVSPTFEALAPSGDYLIGLNRSSTTATVLTALNSSGVSVATLSISATIARQRLASWAMIGTPSATYTYMSFARTGTGITLARFDNAGTFTTATPGSPRYVAAWQNRLVQAVFSSTGTPSGADGSASTVFFSSPLDPETYDSTDWETLSPGDGENITGMVSWRDYLFVFKETAMYVFYGTSTDSTGGAIFNYRKVDLGFRVASDSTSMPPKFVVVAGKDGVYIAGYEGIYRTAGDVPQKISDPIDPLFDGDLSPEVFWADDRLLVRGTTAYPWLVWDWNTRDWAAWDIALTAGNAVGWQVGTSFLRERMYFISASGDARTTAGHIYVMDPDATDDAGTAIAWRWQSGFYDLGSPDSKRVGPVTLWGSGTVTVSVFTDHGSTDANSGSVTLGTAPVVARGRHQKTYRGRLLSHVLSGSGPAVVHQAAVTVRDQRVS